MSLDPIYVYFDADERAYLKYTRLAQEGKRPSSRDNRNPVQIGFADEEGFPHRGYMDFVDNQLDAQHGHDHRPRRAPNPDLQLSPGLFARVRLVGSGEYPAILDSRRGARRPIRPASSSTSSTPTTTRRYRPVTLGPLIDGLRVVAKGCRRTNGSSSTACSARARTRSSIRRTR